MRLLVIPALTKLAAASPFHCCLVSPGSKRAFLTCPPNHVDNWSVSHAESAFRDGHHRGMVYFFLRALLLILDHSFHRRCWSILNMPAATPHIDKRRLALENRRFSSLRGKALQ